ncbi:hypothetical protein PVK06_042111 [Gossypium arboreum]|uniref:Uncharacterized protein n=1 Tax=Gossypium arboreum TaxID=29729 RepID=A0ABR0NB11_GOSAR|nr:hypothetical protein PVK06_042111 [Gossypium arboreum]
MSCKCFGSFDWFKGSNSPDQTQAQEFTNENVKLFTYNSLRSATSDFHQSNRIGAGGFGVVYRTWKLKEEDRLLDIVDPELSQYPEEEVLRFVKVALFCTQAVANQRPTMKQVVEMLSKEVNLNEKLLSEPGVYKGQNPRRWGVNKDQQAFDPSSSTRIFSSHIITQMLPR